MILLCMEPVFGIAEDWRRLMVYGLQFNSLQ
jgi:hypothetical protein